MENQTKNFLEFNGKSIYFLGVDGTTWVALKPICEALNVNWNRQFQNLKDDEILTQLFAEQQMVAADGRLRQMIALPEMYIYGWLFSINSESEELKKYKLTCYKILYNHFHGAMTARLSELRVKSEAELRIEQLESALLDTPEYKELQDEKAKVKNQGKILKKLDDDLQKKQTNLFAAMLN